MWKFYRKAVGRVQPQPHGVSVGSLLLLLRRFRHQYVRFHTLAATALAHSSYGRRIQIVATHREPAIGADRRTLMGDIETAPTQVGTEPHIHPGVAGRIAG